MQRFLFRWLLAVVLFVSSGVSVSCSARDGKPLSAYGVVPEAVYRVEILYFPERILTDAALTPERLERQYYDKIELKNFNGSIHRPRFIKAFRETAVSPSRDAHDARTAILLYDKTDKRLLSIYFDRSGENGVVNSDLVSIGDSLFSWAKSLMKGLAE
jgi:hypothetical protein